MTESSNTSPSNGDSPKIKAFDALQKAADDAATFSRNLDVVLQSTARIERIWLGIADTEQRNNFPIGAVGFFASLQIRLKHGFRTGAAPDPSFTRERFLDECASIYDLLDVYIGVQKRDTTDGKTDNRPNGEGTRG